MYFKIKIIVVLFLILTTQTSPIFGSLELNAQSKDSIILAGGCFWCMEESFDQIEGVLSSISGYSGGHLKNPTYQDVIYNNRKNKMSCVIGVEGGHVIGEDIEKIRYII